MTKVHVEQFRGNLRLRWSIGGRRFCLSSGLSDTALNRAIAQITASEIEKDITLDRFDATLIKYKPDIRGASTLKVSELFEKFIEYKRKSVYTQTLIKYESLLSRLRSFFKDLLAVKVGLPEAEKFTTWLSEQTNPATKKPISVDTVNERLSLLSACWTWGIEQHLVEHNPWLKIPRRKNRTPRQGPKPFTVEEIQAIIHGFRVSRYYAYYADYVEFLLCSGCRIGEAIALRWEHVSDDCSQIWIGQAYYRGVTKPTKTNKSGWVPLSKSLQLMFIRRRPPNYEPSALVFPAAEGGSISDQNFRKRAWKGVLEQVNVPYRKPYTSRSTLISYWLSQGEDPLTVAKYTRTSIKMIYEHYAGSIVTKAKLPEIPIHQLALNSEQGTIVDIQESPIDAFWHHPG